MRYVVAVAVLLVGCGDSTGPEVPFGVALSATVHAEGFNTQADRYECQYTLRATVTGESGDEATWYTGEVEFRPDDGSAWSTFSLGVVDLVDMWGSSTLRVGTPLEAQRIAWLPGGGFQLRHTFRYFVGDENDGEIRSVTVFTC